MERIYLNELENRVGIKLLRNDHRFAYIIGRFPDGLEPELKLVALFDEKHHFVDEKEMTIYNEDSIRETKDYESIGLIVFRRSAKQWEENKEQIIQEFQTLISQLSEQNKEIISSENLSCKV